MNVKIFEMRNKVEYVARVADLICFIRRSFIEHLTSIYPTLVFIELVTNNNNNYTSYFNSTHEFWLFGIQ